MRRLSPHAVQVLGKCIGSPNNLPTWEYSGNFDGPVYARGIYRGNVEQSEVGRF